MTIGLFGYREALNCDGGDGFASNAGVLPGERGFGGYVKSAQVAVTLPVDSQLATSQRHGKPVHLGKRTVPLQTTPTNGGRKDEPAQ